MGSEAPVWVEPFPRPLVKAVLQMYAKKVRWKRRQMRWRDEGRRTSGLVSWE